MPNQKTDVLACGHTVTIDADGGEGPCPCIELSVFACRSCGRETEPTTTISLQAKRCTCGAYDWKKAR